MQPHDCFVADAILAAVADDPLSVWVEELAQQRPHPLWDGIGDTTPLERVNATSLHMAEEDTYRRRQEHALSGPIAQGMV